jgi:hypothetical protein
MRQAVHRFFLLTDIVPIKPALKAFAVSRTNRISGFPIRDGPKTHEIIEPVRNRREEANHNLDFASQPFVLCGLPAKGPVIFGTDTQREKATAMRHSRGDYTREARIWCSRDLEQEMLPNTSEEEVVPSDSFCRESALVFVCCVGIFYVALLPPCKSIGKRRIRSPSNVPGAVGQAAGIGPLAMAYLPARIGSDGNYILVAPALALSEAEA